MMALLVLLLLLQLQEEKRQMSAVIQQLALRCKSGRLGLGLLPALIACLGRYECPPPAPDMHACDSCLQTWDHII